MKVGAPLALGIAIAGQVLYHLTQKNVSAGAHPVVALLAFYLLAALLCLPLFFWFPLDAPLAASFGRLNGAVAGVAVSIVLIEVGFLLAYRAGVALSTAFVLTAAAVTAALYLVGLLLLGERTSATQVAGIALCIGGVWLVSRPVAAVP